MLRLYPLLFLFLALLFSNNSLSLYGAEHITQLPPLPEVQLAENQNDELFVQKSDDGDDEDEPSPSDQIIEIPKTTVTAPSCNCNTGCCDCCAISKANNAAAKSHKGLFCDNRFDYLCDECYNGNLLGDQFKRRGLGDWITYDVGGQYRMRAHHERNMRGAGLSGFDDDFLLHRTRIYANVEMGDRIRLYGEMLDAVSEFEDRTPLGIEENRADIQNLFADFKIFEGCCGDTWARVGRQELLYGAQRTVSPLDWANTRRTFEGAKFYYQGDRVDFDAFWVRPMTRNVNQLDSPDQSQEFMGFYSTIRDVAGGNMDAYFLRYLETDGARFHYNTFGARHYGAGDFWKWELEAAYQFGDVGAFEQSAGAYTLGLGHQFSCYCWKPTLWAFYDWASGDENGNGYHHNFPLAHKYLGFMDIYGRRNIEDLNFLMVMKPADKWKLLVWYHIFKRQNALDVPYNVSLVPGATAAGGSGDLGQEIDVTLSWQVAPRVNLLFGYSHFFAGDFYGTNGTVPFDGDADFFYTQMTVNF